MKIDRLLAIVVLLLNRRKATAGELANHFGVSIRTVYRDIESINRAGIPIVSYQGYEGGFCIMDNYKLNRQLLTFQDMISILSALKGVNTTFQDRQLENAIGKISALVPESKELEYKRHGEQFVMDIMPWGYGKRQQELIQRVQQAISSSTLLKFTYRNSRNEVIKRTVEPMTLVFKPPGWYLFAYCRRKEDYRVFKLSRMRQLEPTREAFVRRDKSYHEAFGAEYDRRSPVELVLRFSPSMSGRVDEWFTEEPVFEEDGSCTIRFSMPEDDWVYAMIMSYGEHVEVLSPAHIRTIIAQKTEEVLKKYRNLT
jgi:predicted DNA-binding transcriptional regulator YafY